MDKHRNFASEMVRGCGECKKDENCLSNGNIICVNKPLLHAVIITSKEKNKEFSKLVDDTLRFMDCDAYNGVARSAFRLFAEELLKRLTEE
mgnify:CR=1 FL=1